MKNGNLMKKSDLFFVILTKKKTRQPMNIKDTNGPNIHKLSGFFWSKFLKNRSLFFMKNGNLMKKSDLFFGNFNQKKTRQPMNIKDINGPNIHRRSGFFWVKSCKK